MGFDLIGGVQFGLVYLVTLLIEWSQGNSFDTEMAFQRLFVQGAALWPWELSLESLRFLCVTLFFALVATMLVFTGQYCDPYPHYSGVFKRFLQAKTDLQDTLTHWINTLMAERRGTYQPLNPPVLNNPLQAELQSIESAAVGLKNTLQQFQAGIQTMAAALQQQHHQARREYMEDFQQRFSTILQGDVDQEETILKSQPSTHHTNFGEDNDYEQI